MTQDQADELFAAMKGIITHIDMLMAHEATQQDGDLRQSIGEMSGQFGSWLDYDFIKLMKRKYPHISIKAIDQ